MRAATPVPQRACIEISGGAWAFAWSWCANWLYAETLERGRKCSTNSGARFPIGWASLRSRWCTLGLLPHGMARLKAELSQHQLPDDVTRAVTQSLKETEFERAHALMGQAV